jgi:actin
MGNSQASKAPNKTAVSTSPPDAVLNGTETIPAKQPEPVNVENVIAVHLGSRHIAGGYVDVEDKPSRIIDSWITSPPDDDMFAIQNQEIKDWDVLEKLWERMFKDEFKVASEEWRVSSTETFLMSKENKDRYAQLMFEKFNVKALHSADAAQAAMFSTGRTTGVLIDLGFDTSRVAAVYEGEIVNKNASFKLSYGGKHQSEFLRSKLEAKGYSLSPSIVEDIKKKLSFCVYKYEEEMNIAQEQRSHFTFPGQSMIQMEVKDENGGPPDIEYDHGFRYELPDGQLVTLGNERFQCVEALFRPSLLEKTELSIAEAAVECIKRSDIDIRKELYGNVVLVGGASLPKALDTRLYHEIVARAPSSMSVKVIHPHEAEFSAWIGAAILGSLTTTVWQTKGQYEEVGTHRTQ